MSVQVNDLIICVPSNICYEQINIFKGKKWTNHDVTYYSHKQCNLCGAKGHISSQCKFWKTKMCWHAAAHCPWGSNCSFAHCENELRKLN